MEFRLQVFAPNPCVKPITVPRAHHFDESKVDTDRVVREISSKHFMQMWHHKGRGDVTASCSHHPWTSAYSDNIVGLG